MRARLPALLLGALMMVRPVWADSHGVTVVNSGTEIIRRIEIGTSDNRLRSQLPPGAQARITYSTGCQADVRLGFDSGRTETFTAVDVCGDPRVEAGKGVTTAAAGTAARAPSSGSGVSPAARPGSGPSPTTVSATSPVKAPPPVVPPWTGKSITKRFGGLD